MPGAWHEFAPAVTVEQTIDGAVIHLLPDSGLKGLPDLAHRGDLSRLGTGEEGGEELLFFLQRQILMTTASLPRRLHRRHSEPIVRGDDLMDGRFGDSTVPGNLLRLAWLHQRILNDQPPLPIQGARSGSHSSLHFFCRQMFCGMRDSCHTFPLLFSVFIFFILSQNADWYER